MEPWLRKRLSKAFQAPEVREAFKRLGAEGGKIRAKRLSRRRRRAIAKAAARARWARKRRP